MFKAMFSFRGRLTRRGFAARIGVLVGAVVGFAWVCAVARLGDAQRLAPLGVLVIPWVWSALSLYARRLRDLGVRPEVVLPMFVALTALDIGFLGELTRARFPIYPFSGATPMVGALQAGLFLMLALAPGRKAKEDALPVAEEGASEPEGVAA